MKRHAIIKPAVFASSILFVGATSGLTAGEPAPIIPAPAPECGNAGWTFTAAALYLKSYGTGSALIDDESLYSGGTYDGDFDWGFRGSIGYERPDGLFFRLVGFWWEGDYDRKNGSTDFDGDEIRRDGGSSKAYSFDLLVGDTFCPTQNTSVEVSAGLRYAKVERDQKIDAVNVGDPDINYSLSRDLEFDGWGPTFQIRGRRTLTDRIGLYADFQQSFLFGEAELSHTKDGLIDDDWDDKGTADTLAAISEIRGGIEFLWGWNQIQNAYLRLGGEGQYWWIDSDAIGLVGGVAEVGFNF